MARITEEQRRRFLDLVRRGVDRIEAARATGEQASTYQILSLEDPTFRQDLKEALRESWKIRNREESKRLSQDTRREFLELIRDGKDPREAALAVGGKFNQFARLCNVVSVHYDPDFHADYIEAINEGTPAFHSRLRNLMITSAENGEYRALRDLVIMHLPEGERLSAKKIEVRDGDLDLLKNAALKIKKDNLSNEELAEMIRLLEKAASKPKPHLELVSGDEGEHDIIEETGF